jgi:hypothetical protein
LRCLASAGDDDGPHVAARAPRSPRHVMRRKELPARSRPPALTVSAQELDPATRQGTAMAWNIATGPSRSPRRAKHDRRRRSSLHLLFPGLWDAARRVVRPDDRFGDRQTRSSCRDEYRCSGEGTVFADGARALSGRTDKSSPGGTGDRFVAEASWSADRRQRASDSPGLPFRLLLSVALERGSSRGPRWPGERGTLDGWRRRKCGVARVEEVHDGGCVGVAVGERR